MICGKCRAEVSGQNGHEHAGRTLCEDCYIDVVSAPKTCDPWAVYSATRTVAKGESLTPDQCRIVDLLKSKGPLSVEQICAELSLEENDFRSNFSTLRHMELAQACKKDGRVVYLPFAKPVSGSNRPPKREVA
jgi:hypothetical protein